MAPRGLNLSFVPSDGLIGLGSTTTIQPAIHEIITGQPVKSFYFKEVSQTPYGRGMAISTFDCPQISIPKVPTNVFSLEVLVYFAGTVTGPLIRFDTAFPASATFDRNMWFNAGTAKFSIYTGVTQVVASSISISGGLAHVVGVSDGTNLFIYVNGKAAGSHAGGTAYGGNSQFILGGGTNADSVASGTDATILMGNYATVAWTAAEVMERYSDPYCFLEFPVDRLRSFYVATAQAYSDSFSDTLTANETYDGTASFLSSLSESATITDTPTTTADFLASTTDALTVSDSIDGSFLANAEVDGLEAETLLADNTITTTVDGITSETLLAETCTARIAGIAVETLLFSFNNAHMGDDGMTISDQYFAVLNPNPTPIPKPPAPVRSTDLTIGQQPYPPVPTNMQDWQGWNQQMANTINGVLAGKTNNTLASFTLTANSTTTTLYMSQIGATSVISLTPLTQNAASATYWISDQKSGQATINHADSATTDRTYSVMVVA